MTACVKAGCLFLVSYYKVAALHDFNNVVMYYEHLVEFKDMQIVGIGTTQEFKIKKRMPLSKLREAFMLKISLFDFETMSGKLGKYHRTPVIFNN